MSKLETNSNFKIRKQIAAKLRTSNFGFRISIFFLALAPLVAVAANLAPVDPTEIHWTHGFWAERVETCRTQTVPAIWRIMEGTNYSQFFENFRIAAGL